MFTSLARRLPATIKDPIRRRVVAGRRPAPPADPTSRRESWERDGFLVLPGLFDRRTIKVATRRFDEAWARRADSAGDGALVIDAFVTGGTQRRMLLADAPAEARHEVYKLNDLYLVDEHVRSMVLAEPLVAAMRDLVDDEVVAINSLHFERGSSQDFHVDTFFMAPPLDGQLIVSSICLEDVHPEAGPLQYFPGSHTIVPHLNAEGNRRARDGDELELATGYLLWQCDMKGLLQARFHGFAGDAFLWHEQLVHGGSPIIDMRRTRRSIVTHYWTKSSMPPDADIVPFGAGYYLRRDPQPI